MNDCVLVLVLLCRFWQLRMVHGFCYLTCQTEFTYSHSYWDVGILLARPRFELGSKAPKASMLGRYSRRNRQILHRASRAFLIGYPNFIMLRIFS